jgi:Flp pilus assembly protein TadD
LDPNKFSVHYLLGIAFKQLGRISDADREFELSRASHGDQKP